LTPGILEPSSPTKLEKNPYYKHLTFMPISYNLTKNKKKGQPYQIKRTSILVSVHPEMVDFRQKLDGEMFEPLRDIPFFKNFTVNQELHTGMNNCYNILPSQMRDLRGRLITIRPYEDSDYRDLKEMYDNFQPKGLEAGLPPLNRKTRHEWIDQMVSSFYNVLAFHRGSVIGHATLDIPQKDASPEYLIFIRQGFRYSGIGTIISEIMKEVARDTGCKKVWLIVRTGNAIAVRTFKKVGFKFTGEIDIQREMELIIKRSEQ